MHGIQPLYFEVKKKINPEEIVINRSTIGEKKPPSSVIDPIIDLALFETQPNEANEWRRKVGSKSGNSSRSQEREKNPLQLARSCLA